MYVNILRQRAGLGLITAPPSGSSTITLTAPAVTLTSATAANIQFAGDSWNAPQGAVAISGGLLTSSGKSYLVPPRAVEIHANPGTSPYSVMLPFAVPINAKVRLQFHATDPAGYQTTYKTVDALNPSYPPPAPTAPTVLRVTSTGSDMMIMEFDIPVTGISVGSIHANAAANTNAAPTADPRVWQIDFAAYTPGPGDAWTIAAAATSPTPNTAQHGVIL
jgi:hypothetical protein